jgi:hypothetical protein
MLNKKYLIIKEISTEEYVSSYRFQKKLLEKETELKV